MSDPIREIELNQWAADIEAISRNEANFDEDEIEPSEEDIALKPLDKEHLEDYLAIKNAVRHTNLAERLVDMAVKLGLKERT